MGAIAAGDKLGPYEIISALGVGGMGEVYRAIDTRLKRQVAVKVLLAAKRYTEARGDFCQRPAAAVLPAHGRVHFGGRRLRMNQRANGIEEHGADNRHDSSILSNASLLHHAVS